MFFVGLHIFMVIKWKRRLFFSTMPKSQRKEHFMRMWKSSPIFDNGHLQFYALRIPMDQSPDGSNNNTDHQLARQGVYSFLMQGLGLDNVKISRAIGFHMSGDLLATDIVL